MESVLPAQPLGLRAVPDTTVPITPGPATVVPTPAVPALAGTTPARDARRGHDPTRSLRRGLNTACAVGLVALLVFRWANREAGIDTEGLTNAAIGIGLGVTGALLTSRLPRNPLGWLFLVGSLCQAVTGVGREWTVFGAVTSPEPLPGIVWSAWLSGVAQPVTLATLPLVLLHFPDGRLASRRWRPVRWLALAVGALMMALSAVTPGPFTPQLPQITNPLGLVDSATAVMGPAWDVASVLTMATIALAAASLIWRWRHASETVRQQIRWITLTGTLMAAELIYDFLPFSSTRVADIVGPLALVIFSGSIGYAVLRHHLWDLDVLVNLSLVYALLTLVAAVVFVLGVALAGGLIDNVALLWPVTVAIGVVAIVLVPLRHGVQTVTDWLLYGQRRDPQQMLVALSRRLDATDAADATEHVLRDAVDAIAAAFLRLDHVSIEAGEAMVATGTARTAPVRLPLVFNGVDVGVLEVAARPGSPLQGRSLASMREVADQLAPIVHGVTVTAAITRMRHDVVTAREEERRRLRRDIHDGLGPSLAAIALRLQGAESLVDRQPDAAKAVLTQLSGEVGQIIDDIRRLVYNLQPPVLDALGLAPAVRQLALTFSHPGPDPTSTRHLQVTVEAPEHLGDLPAAAEVTAYRIVGEALANVSHHSHATQAVVTLHRAPAGLVITVDDNGGGMPDRAGLGVGTLSMIERATAMGGECVRTPSPLGGVQVRAVLPVGVPATNPPLVNPRTLTGGGHDDD